MAQETDWPYIPTSRSWFLLARRTGVNPIMHDTPSLVSVIVPCRNEEDHIEDCVESILAQELPPESFEIIVADGMSDDRTRDILKQLAAAEPRLHIVDNPGQIVSTGLNAAIEAAQGSVIVRMDAHTEYAPDYLRQCLAVFEETGAENVGGPARTTSTGYVQAAICAAYHSPFAVGGARFHDEEYEGYVDTVTYGCWPREVFDRIGRFDENLVRNQDDEFNLRLTRAGGRIWQSPRIKSWYRPRASLRALFSQYMQYGYWKVPVIQKHRIPASIRHLAPGGFVLSLLVLAVASAWSPLAAWCWIALIGSYGVCNLVASFLTAAQAGWKLILLLPLVFACYHFGYGYGFLRGLWDFYVRRGGPARKYRQLIRTSGHGRLPPQKASDPGVSRVFPAPVAQQPMENVSSEPLSIEETRIRTAYAKRQQRDARYSWFNPSHLFIVQERERRMLALLRRHSARPLETSKIFEIGCGTGYWLREFIKWGARPENVVGIDLLADRVTVARQLCPQAVRVQQGNAAKLDFPNAAFDLVLQSTVFTSVLDAVTRQMMASEMLRVVKDDGLILWYDYHINNPWNPDVRGVKKCEISRLFPDCQIALRWITLAPPLVRLLSPYSWLACHLLGKIPYLCTHYLGVIQKGR
jgi:glycosyltransferase involved in cell wall biosynthesis/SAM-dependent methyltransferase